MSNDPVTLPGAPDLAPEIAQQVQRFTMGQLFHLLRHIKKLAAQAPAQAQLLLVQHPPICHALLHAECLAGTVEEPITVNFLINWSISELNTLVHPTTCLSDTDCWIQQFTAPTMVVTRWILYKKRAKCTQTVDPTSHCQSWCSDLLDPTTCVTQASCWTHLCI